jgi:uncharacterized protein YaiI (UPF0178 family)
VDADACPVAIKEIVYRAAQRTGCPAVFVANHPLTLPPSPYLQFRQVPQGFDVADNEIARGAGPGDLVVTGDVPLAAIVVEEGATAVSPRGEAYTTETVRSRLAIRDLMTGLRDSGVSTGGPAPLDAGDRQRFANLLDRWLAKRG